MVLSVTASDFPSPHLINSPDSHFSICEMGEIWLPWLKSVLIPGFKSYLCCLPAVWLWANHLSLSFLISERGDSNWHGVVWIRCEHTCQSALTLWTWHERTATLKHSPQGPCKAHMYTVTRSPAPPHISYFHISPWILFVGKGKEWNKQGGGQASTRWETQTHEVLIPAIV